MGRSLTTPTIITDASPSHAGPGPVVALVRDEFAAGLHAVRRWGGVLAVPAGHPGWAVMGLEKPLRQWWSAADWDGGWCCRVEQGQYGHRARRPMWLYAARCALPSLRWGPSQESAATGRLSRSERMADAPELVATLEAMAATVRVATKARLVTAFGESRTVYEWGELMGIGPQTIYRRLENGYSHEAAVSKFRPSRKSGSAEADVQPGEPGSLSWDLLEWDEDPWAWRVVAERAPMDLATIGEYFGLSIQRAQEMEQEILTKLRCALEIESVLGVAKADEWFTRLRGDNAEAFERAVKRARKMVAWGVVEGRL